MRVPTLLLCTISVLASAMPLVAHAAGTCSGFPDVYPKEAADCAKRASKTSCLEGTREVVAGASKGRSFINTSCRWTEPVAGGIKITEIVSTNTGSVDASGYDAYKLTSTSCQVKLRATVPSASAGRWYSTTGLTVFDTSATYPFGSCATSSNQAINSGIKSDTLMCDTKLTIPIKYQGTANYGSIKWKAIFNPTDMGMINYFKLHNIFNETLSVQMEATILDTCTNPDLRFDVQRYHLGNDYIANLLTSTCDSYNKIGCSRKTNPNKKPGAYYLSTLTTSQPLEGLSSASWSVDVLPGGANEKVYVNFISLEDLLTWFNDCGYDCPPMNDYNTLDGGECYGLTCSGSVAALDPTVTYYLTVQYPRTYFNVLAQNLDTPITNPWGDELITMRVESPWE